MTNAEMWVWPVFVATSLHFILLTVCGADAENRYRHGRRVIDTSRGKVQGLLVEFSNKKVPRVEVYLGLQYASLLAGRLRFMPPTNPVEKWKGIRMLITPRPACPQKHPDEAVVRRHNSQVTADYVMRMAGFTRQQTEDCLSLNMYVPVKEANETAKFPVMVFLHGESYDSGTGNAYDGSVLASYGRVIVITLNYRLGVLGFLAAGANTNIAGGNYALLDIIAGLHWVKENIAHFGGDPGRVTLFGHGYGAAIVNLLLVSPLTKDGKLFQRGILQSGSALSSWAVAEDPVTCTRMLAEIVNCSAHLNDAQELVSCLRTFSAEYLVNIAPESPKYLNCFAPSVSTRSSVIPLPVHRLHEARNSVFAKGSLMFGLTKNEAVSYLTKGETIDGLTALRKAQIIRTYVHNTFKYNRQKIYEILDHHYTEWNRVIQNFTRRNAVMELLSDGQFVAPLLKVGNFHENSAPTYFYYFAHSSRSDGEREWSGSVHGEELAYVFGAPLIGGSINPFESREYSKTEQQLSEAVMTYWSNFAKSGDPNVPVKVPSLLTGRSHQRSRNGFWAEYTDKNQSFLQISPRPKLGGHYRGRQLALWLDLIPKIHKPDGSDPKEHLLKDYHNMTTFDSPDKLVRVANLFPPLKTESMEQENPTGTTHTSEDIQDIYVSTDIIDVTLRPPLHQSEEDRNASSPSGSVVGSHSVQVSITIAVGCSLLFLNILIFAGIYYQRERIKRLKSETADPEGIQYNRKCDDEKGQTTAPETISLLSSPLPQSHQTSHRKYHQDTGHSPPTIKSSQTYVPMPKVPSFSYSGTKPVVLIDPCPQITESQKENNHIKQVNVLHNRLSTHLDKSCTVTIV